MGALGWSVALGARRLAKLEQVALEVVEAGGKAFAHSLDVRDPNSTSAFSSAAERALGPVDVLVNNAGIGIPGLLQDLSVEDLRDEIDTNLLGTMLLVREVLPGMLERKRGDLVFVTSLNAVSPRPYQAGYSATKAAVEALARTLQMELEGSGVRATIVRPGPAKTEMGSGWDAAQIKRMLKAWKHWGVLRHHGYLPPESIASAVVSAVLAPRGTHLDLIQVNPEAPVENGG